MELADSGQARQPVYQLGIVQLVERAVQLSGTLLRAVHQRGEEAEDVAGQEGPDGIAGLGDVLL